MQSFAENIIYIVIIVILPIIPAYVLFKKLPSTAIATGPFHGLNLNLSGAFAGYFIVVLVVSASVTFFYQKPRYDMWTIKGSILLDKSETGADARNANLSIQPPKQTIFPDGGFEFVNVPYKKGDALPSIIVAKDGYGLATAHLGEQYKVAYDENNKTITILHPIALEKERVAYNPTVTAVKIDNQEAGKP